MLQQPLTVHKVGGATLAAFPVVCMTVAWAGFGPWLDVAQSQYQELLHGIPARTMNGSQGLGFIWADEHSLALTGTRLASGLCGGYKK